jgi:hypothetical protein
VGYTHIRISLNIHQIGICVKVITHIEIIKLSLLIYTVRRFNFDEMCQSVYIKQQNNNKITLYFTLIKFLQPFNLIYFTFRPIRLADLPCFCMIPFLKGHLCVLEQLYFRILNAA